MKTGASEALREAVEQHEGRRGEEPPLSHDDGGRQRAARQIAVESKRLWREAQRAGLDDLAKLMEEAFYRAYQEAGGAKVMRAV